MNLYLDCEYNEFRGALISMALVPAAGPEFYEVVELHEPAGRWVRENVLPVLGKAPIPWIEFQRQLRGYLSRFDALTIVADWPDDIRHFCAALITGPGVRLQTPPLSFEIRDELSSRQSAIPHNALADARAIRAMAEGLSR